MAETKAVNQPLFAYGTLRPGGSFYGLVGPYLATHEPGYLHGAQMYSLGVFPGVVLDPTNRTPVRGELLYVLDDWWDYVVTTLDRIEDEGEMYRRLSLVVMTEDEEPVLAWCYVLAKLPRQAEAYKIENNDWFARAKNADLRTTDTSIQQPPTDTLSSAAFRKGLGIL